MLPLKLKIQGVNSYQNEQVIEFDNLLEAKIFGIFGEVGSGKSSILDAISYTLYGKMDKLKGERIGYNIMNLKSNNFLIEFDFKTENEDKYKFVVKGKRNSKKFEEVTIKKQQYKWNGKEWVPREGIKAEDILGLSYDNFKRTIIIPQGKFMDFIQLPDKDRTKMYEEIFDLHKYDLLYKVSQFQKENNETIANLNGKLSQFEKVSKEEITTIEKELDDILEARQWLNNDLGLKEKELKSLFDLKVSFEDWGKKEKLFIDIDSKKENFINKEKELEEYQVCLTSFKPLLKSLEIIEEKLYKNINLLSDNKEKFDKLNLRLKSKKIKFEGHKKDYNNLDTYKKQREEFDKLILIKEIEEKISNCSTELQNTNREHEKIKSEKEKLRNHTDLLKNKINEIEEKAPNIILLSEVKEWLSNKQKLKTIISEFNENLTKKRRTILELNSGVKNIISVDDQRQLGVDITIDIMALIKNLESKINEYVIGLKDIQDKRDDLLIKDKLKQFSKSLKEGDQCPVCGSKDHPNPIEISHIEKDLSKVKNRIKNGEKIIEKLRKYIDGLKQLSSKIENENKNIGEVEGKLKETEIKLDLFLKTFKWVEFKDYSQDKINQLFEEAKSFTEKLKKLRIDYDQALVRIQDEQKLLDEKRKHFEESTKELSHLMTQQKVIVGQIKELSYADYFNKSSEEIVDQKSILVERIKSIEHNYISLEKEINQLEIDKKEYETLIRSFGEAINEFEEDKVNLSKNINEKLNKHHFDSIELVQEILKKDINITLVKKEIEDFKIRHATLKKEIARIKDMLQDKIFDDSYYQKLKGEIKSLKIKIEGLDNKIGSLKSNLSKLKTDLIQKYKYEKELSQNELRSADLREMKSLFIGSGFVNYISTVRLQEVVNYANSRFHKLSKGRLKLELNEKNSFNVIDFLNDGKRRSIKTLSGGQIFQASLSLALALASIVQKQNKSKHNFFFLDEGFGTQDEESLQLVFNTIKSLRKENRIVGLISHVPELKEEISTYLEVINDDEKGSEICKSWEI